MFIADTTIDGVENPLITGSPRLPRTHPSSRHFEGSNVLFGDAHVTVYKKIDLLLKNGKDAAVQRENEITMRLWNNDQKPRQV